MPCVLRGDEGGGDLARERGGTFPLRRGSHTTRTHAGAGGQRGRYPAWGPLPLFQWLLLRSKRPKRPHEAQSPGIVDFEASDASENRSVRKRPKRPQASAPAWPPEGAPRPASRGGPDRLTCRVDLVPPAGGGDLASAIGSRPVRDRWRPLGPAWQGAVRAPAWCLILAA